MLLGLTALVVSAATGLLLSALLTSSSPPASPFAGVPDASATARARRVAFSPGTAQAPLGRYANVIARARGRSVPVFSRAGARRPYRRVAALRVGGRPVPLVFLVRSRRPGWLRVYLPARPNRSSGWLRMRDVTLSQTTYRVRVEQRRHLLIVWRGNRLVARERIAVGKAVSPTPLGRYFVADLIRPPNPRGFYGPYALGLSAFSQVYTTFAGGNGQVGMHGTNNPSLIGKDVSHGCVRLTNRAITRLAKMLPLGTPVDIAR